MPAPVFESTSTTGEQYASAFAPGLPAGLAEGDLLLAVGWSSLSLTSPAGWDTVLTESTATGFQLQVLSRIAGVSESGPTFTTASATNGRVSIYRFSNADPVSPLAVWHTSRNTLNAPSVTTAADNLILHLFASGNTGATISVPAGDTQIEAPAGSYVGSSAGYELQATAGPSGSAAFDDGGATTNQATATLAITPPFSRPSGIVLEHQLAHYWPLADQDGADVWGGDAFESAPAPSIGSLADAVSTPHATLGATRLTNDGSASTAVWEATSASFDPAAYTIAGWMRPIYTDVVPKGFEAGIDASQNNIGGATRDADNARTFGADGGTGLATRDISPGFESGTWQFFAVRVSATHVTLNVDGEPAVTDTRGVVRSPGSVNWRLYVKGNGASIAPVEFHGWGVWGRVLSDDEVTALYNSGSAVGFPLLTNGEATASLSLQLPGDMTPRLLQQAQSLTLSSDDVVSPVLADSSALTLPPADDLVLAVLSVAEGMTLHAERVSSPCLPATEWLTLGAGRPVSPLLSEPESISLVAVAGVTPPLLTPTNPLRLEPVLIGPELPEFITGLTLATGEPGAVLSAPDGLLLSPQLLGVIVQPSALKLESGSALAGSLTVDTGLVLNVEQPGPVVASAEPLSLSAKHLGGAMKSPKLTLASESVLYAGLAADSGLTLRLGNVAATLPAAEPLKLQPVRMGGGLAASGPLDLGSPATLITGLSSTEALTLVVASSLTGLNELQSIEPLTLTITTEFSGPRLMALPEALTLSLSDLPGTLQSPVLTLSASEVDDARLLTRPRQLMLRADRFVTHSFERVNLISLRSRRARLQSLSVTN